MLVHTCRCIFSFVLIGFYYKRKGFQKLFENGFEILEKEKKMEFFSFLNFWPEGLFPLLLFPACSAFSPPLSAEEASPVYNPPAGPLHKPLAHSASSTGSPASLVHASRIGSAQSAEAIGRLALSPLRLTSGARCHLLSSVRVRVRLLPMEFASTPRRPHVLA
jgi:hypothetical protein